MKNKTPFHFLIFSLAVLWRTVIIAAANRCLACGHIQVPFPLSTGPNCGDQQYKVRCNAGTLSFDTLNGSSYVITSINPLMQRLRIRPPGLVDKKTCMATDLWSQGILLDDNLPFNITGSNTVIAMNCSSEVLELSINCSSSSPCHNYIRENIMVKLACGSSPLCCYYKTGGSLNAYRIRIRKERCSAYESFVNLDTSLPVSKWPEPGVELGWASPREPMCKLPVDCKDLANSDCLQAKNPASAGERRCLCKFGYRWDAINRMCQRKFVSLAKLYHLLTSILGYFTSQLVKIRGPHRKNSLGGILLGHNAGVSSSAHLKCPNGRACKKRKTKAALIAGSAFSGVAMLMGVVTWFIVYKRRERNKREAQQSLSKVRGDILNANNSGRSAKIFTGKEITRATNNFSKQNLIGSGGFGEVFKAILDDGTVTAVKRAKHGNIKGVDQILNEVRILCQVNHRSLVRLIGCCIELDQPLLIYEYIPNGSLFDRLHGNQSSCKWISLSWSDRLRIAHQTAEGLVYLHTCSVPTIYHRDIKSSNILLDDKLDAKVSDFGLSRLVVNETSHVTTCAQAFEFEESYRFQQRREDVNLVVYMKRVYREERLMNAIDHVLKNKASHVELESMKALGSLAMACLDERRRDRPSMKQVADEIDYIITILSSGV
ncbi:hypothetical protein FNV43_RR09811 [Rhamnella rubrinervis]|uniref:Protein kinase domain-containing protein n=1 Tax=Rhamnella rubrinervis TaxID=2594499 RepID=A0A8K0HAM9_9ROSA|nr:hypothetical protein FNV43_RR09811 [Rhamnella rubrinervis]